MDLTGVTARGLRFPSVVGNCHSFFSTTSSLSVNSIVFISQSLIFSFTGMARRDVKAPKGRSANQPWLWADPKCLHSAVCANVKAALCHIQPLLCMVIVMYGKDRSRAFHRIVLCRSPVSQLINKDRGTGESLGHE